MNLQKQKPFRSKKYLSWVRSLPCCISGMRENIVAHHIISCGMGGGMGTKPSDLFTIPINAGVHSLFHADGLNEIDQKAEALRTIEKAVNAGVLIMGDYE